MDAIKKLTDLFAKFPTIGQRTASRFVFYLISLPKERVQELANALLDITNNVSFCQFCFNPHELKAPLCDICQTATRNRLILCIVEKETDLLAIEKTKRYKGLYFIIGNSLPLFKHQDPNALRLPELSQRLKNPKKFGLDTPAFTEIIIALNPTPEGKATSLLVERTLKEVLPSTTKITHLAKGIPVGGELEYADEETLESAFEGRR